LANRGTLAADADVAVVGAGPYGLAAASHLRAAGADVAVFGSAMSFWRCHMPKGMVLRSPWPGCSIGARPELSIDAYARARNVTRTNLIPLERFVDYGEWVQRQAVPDLDTRKLTRIDKAAHGFQLTLEDGATVRVRRVVMAVGLTAQASRPHVFSQLPPALATHASDHADMAPFAGKRVAVVGAGQSALECATLLSEAGAEVELFARTPQIRWLAGGPAATFQAKVKNVLAQLLDPPAPVGPFPLNWIVEMPGVFRLFWRPLRKVFSERALRPCVSGWLIDRSTAVRFRTATAVVAARQSGSAAELALSDGSKTEVDHVLLATGYRVNIARYGLLGAELLKEVRQADGYPVLHGGMESSVAGLHFLGAPAVQDFGPLMRFVAGTGFAARRLTRSITEKAK
jgi:cation diffusion facilitator CzcD-associated flavoprotein CzcO